MWVRFVTFVRSFARSLARSLVRSFAHSTCLDLASLTHSLSLSQGQTTLAELLIVIDGEALATRSPVTPMEQQQQDTTKNDKNGQQQKLSTKNQQRARRRRPRMTTHRLSRGSLIGEVPFAQSTANVNQ